MDWFAGIFQYAYFVEDLEQSAEQFAKTVGAGPFSSPLITRPTVSNIEASPLRQTFPMRLPTQGIAKSNSSNNMTISHRSIATCLMRANSDCIILRDLRWIMRVPNRYWTNRDLRKRVSCMPMVCGLAITTRARASIVLLNSLNHRSEF